MPGPWAARDRQPVKPFIASQLLALVAGLVFPDKKSRIFRVTTLGGPGRRRVEATALPPLVGNIYR